MIVNDNKVLIQVPKCASITTMIIAQRNTAEKNYTIYKGSFPNIHSRYDQAISLNRIDENTEVYVIIRNVYDRIASAFFFRRVRRNQPNNERFQTRTQKMFEKFVLENLETVYNNSLDYSKNRMRNYFYRSQSSYVKDCPSNKLHYILLNDKTKLKTGLEEFFDIEIDVDNLPKSHRSMGLSSYMDLYTPEMIAIVDRLYADDIALYNQISSE